MVNFSAFVGKESLLPAPRITQALAIMSRVLAVLLSLLSVAVGFISNSVTQRR